jgi:aspartate kinase
VVPEAHTIPALSFDEAAELAYFGAKVLHPKTIHPAVRSGIPVRVKNTFEPAHPGTVITAERRPRRPRRPRHRPQAGIAVVNVVSTRMLLAHGFLARIFEVFARHRVVVDLVATSEVSVSCTVDRDDGLDAALERAPRHRRGHRLAPRDAGVRGGRGHLRRPRCARASSPRSARGTSPSSSSRWARARST